MSFIDNTSARIARTTAAAGLCLAVLLGIMAANPHPSFAAAITPGGAALIANTDGSTIRVRSGAGTTFDQVAEAHEGETVSILDGPTKDSGGNTWYKVAAPGGTGWIVSDYLQGKAVSIVAGGKGTIANTDGDTVRVRSGAGTTFDQVAEAHEGETVSILDGPSKDSGGNTWYKVAAPGGTGWIVSDYLQGKVSAPASSNNGGGAADKTGNGLAKGTKATIAHTDGSAIRVRSGAGTTFDQIAEVHEGDAVSITDGPAKDDSNNTWYKVSSSAGTGWVASDYLTPSTASTAKPQVVPVSASKPAPPAAPATPKLTGFARVGNSDGDPVRLRTSASSDGSVITEFTPNTSVAIKQGPLVDSGGTTWYQVSGNSLTGWMMGQYLIQASAPAAPPSAPVAKAPVATPAVVAQAPAAPAPVAPAPAAKPAPPVAVPAVQVVPQAPAPTPTSKPAPAANPDRAAAVVSLGLKYVGSRYVMGGVGPRSFDCSGFVYFILNHSGVPISRDMGAQWNSGTHVSSSALQPGDIVFFSNTYKRGLSHVGIYIGNGRFVHAENESTGVTVTDLWSAYYRAHYSGAVRPRY